MKKSKFDLKIRVACIGLLDLEKVGPDELEPSTHGLKERGSPDSFSINLAPLNLGCSLVFSY